MAVVKLQDLPPAPGSPGVSVEQGPEKKDGVKHITLKDELIETDVELALERIAIATAGRYKSMAFRLFLEGRSTVEIAKEIGIPEVTDDTVLMWARDGEWAIRLKKRNDAREQLVRENVRKLRLEAAEQEAASALRISRRIRERAEKMLDDSESGDGPEITPMGLKNLADAAKASGDPGAHGMGDLASSDPEGAKAKGKTPLVIIFPGGGLPPAPEMKQAETIEVKE